METNQPGSVGRGAREGGGVNHLYSPSIVPESVVDLLVPEMKEMKVLRSF